MLCSVTIDNIALIRHTEIEFTDGFNVLSGETGAGKSILIGSMNMLLGERVSRDLIRNGEKKAMVQALFYANEPEICAFLSENGIEQEDDGTLIVSRELSQDGKNVCRINGQMVTVSKLRELGRLTMNVHGQHDNQALLDRTTHLGFLDSFADGELRGILNEYKEKYKKLCELRKELDDLCVDEEEKLRLTDILNYEINELTAAQLDSDEEEELKRRRTVANNSKKLVGALGQALDILYENQGGECAYNLLASATQLVAQAQDIDSSLEETSQDIESAMVSVSEAVSKLRQYLDSFEGDGLRLEEIEERLDLIYRIKRKYGGSVESALSHLEKSKDTLKNLEFADERRSEIENEISVLLKEVTALARKLTTLRNNAAKILSEQICENLAFLNMPGAKFVADISEKELGESGADSVEFLLSANKGEPPKPLEKIVSGGELSRIMLAIKSILAEEDVAGTLIFDEVDTGVSGRAAQRLGEKLKELSKIKQILCVTHLAQVAASADGHFLIEKSTDADETLTDVTLLDKKGRIEELARIISGDAVSDTTRKQAEEMLDGR